MGCDSKDIIQPIGPLPDGRTLVTRHRPDHTTSLSAIRAAVDGAPLLPGEEFVTTRARADGSHEITGSYASPRSGPAQVATASYRSGWDRTFSAPGGSA